MSKIKERKRKITIFAHNIFVKSGSIYVSSRIKWSSSHSTLIV